MALRRAAGLLARRAAPLRQLSLSAAAAAAKVRGGAPAGAPRNTRTQPHSPYGNGSAAAGGTELSATAPLCAPRRTPRARAARGRARRKQIEEQRLLTCSHTHAPQPQPLSEEAPPGYGDKLEVDGKVLHPSLLNKVRRGAAGERAAAEGAAEGKSHGVARACAPGARAAAARAPGAHTRPPRAPHTQSEPRPRRSGGAMAAARARAQRPAAHPSPPRESLFLKCARKGIRPAGGHPLR